MANPSGSTNAAKKNLPGFRTPPSQRLPLALKAKVVLQPQTYDDIQRGVDLITAAIRPTLGPLPRMVALSRSPNTTAPEILDDGAMIARRIIQIAPRGHDVGAMLLRHALWRMSQESGDGSTTMAVMYQVILEEGIRYIRQANCDAMALHAGMAKGLRAVQECLQQEVLPLVGKENIAHFARGLLQENHELANLMGEVFDIVGAEGLVVVEKGKRLGIEREYLEGTYWHLSGWVSYLFVTDPATKQTTLEDAAILISDLSIRELDQLVPVLTQCANAGIRRLVILAKDISDRAIGLLVTNNQAKTMTTMVVRTPGVLEMERVASMEDISVLTGGRIFYAAAYSDFRDFRIADLGHARRVWATESLFGFFGGKGDPRRIRQSILTLRTRLQQAADTHEQDKLQARLGRVAGATAIVRLAEATDSATDALKTMTTRAVTSLRSALTGGVVLGGGTALLAAQRGLMALPAENASEAIAYKILSRALAEPMRTIAKNAGYQPEMIIEMVKASPKGHGFDARSGYIADMKQMGVFDSLLTLKKALEIAVSGANTALTMDVIVHHQNPQLCLEP